MILIGVAQRSGGELRGHAGVFQSCVGGDETNFVDAHSARAGQGFFQLQSELGGLGFAGGKGLREAAQFVQRNDGKELHAGDARGGKQLRELFFRGRTFERHAVEQQLRSGGAEEQTGFGTGRNGSLQFAPGHVQMLNGAGMVVAVEARKLQQNVEAANEGAGRGGVWIGSLH